MLDIDLKNNGLESLESLESLHGPIAGPKVRSGGNGFHFYFYQQKNSTIRNKVNILPGVDLRGDGGYIVAPPSTHQSGNTYQWESNKLSYEAVPVWLMELLESSGQPKAQSTSVITDNKIGPGSRNTFLASVAGTLVKKQLSISAVQQTLFFMNKEFCYPCLSNTEVIEITQSINKYRDDIIWPELEELPETTYNPPIMDRTLLPSALSEWIIDAAERMQIPYEFIAIPAIVGISAVIGKKFRIYPKQNDNWLVVPNLWGAIVSRPGTFKSPAIAEALRPLESLVEKENDLFSKTMSEWEINKTISEATLEAMKEQLIRSIKKNHLEEADLLKERLKKLQQESQQKAPSCKRLKTNDATIEKIIELLLENRNGLLVVRDELAGWLISLNKYGREGDREFYLEAWNGYGSYTVDRIGRGTIHAPSLCLSILGGIQPDKLEKCITSSLDRHDDGLLQRFQLIIYPEVRGKWKNIDVAPNIIAFQKVCDLVQEIHDFQPAAKKDFHGLHFDPQAQELFNYWREKLETLLRSGTIEHSQYEGHLSKYRSLAPSLALIFQILKTSIKSSVVDIESISLAIRWSEYLIEHAKKVYQASNYPFFRSIQAFQKKLIERKIKDGDTVRSVLRNDWEHLNHSNQLENALTFLSQHHWIQVIENRSTGRPSRIIKIHPELLASFV